MIDLDNNSQFSLENLDVARLTKAISEHQNTVLKIGLIIGTLISAFVIFNGHQGKVRDLHQRTSSVQTKLDAIKARDAAIQDFDKFNSSLPKKLNEIELITLISNYAKGCHITFSSLSPSDNKDMGTYDLISISISQAQSDNFKGMMLFLRKIEKSPFPLRIDTWTGHEDEAGKITFNINISAVLIHT